MSEFQSEDFAQWLLRIEHKIDLLLHKEKRMSKEVDDLTAAVTAETTVEQSAITLINGLATQIQAAKDDPAKVEALAAQISASSTALSAAVTANTPATTPAPTA